MILVTGGAGFIGSNYLYKLHKLDPAQQIVCVDSLTYAANVNYIQPLIDCGFVRLETVDITNRYQLQFVFDTVRPDYVVHFAAETHVDNSIRDLNPFVSTNIVGTINLLAAALTVPRFKKFVHVSTDEVYGSLGPDDASFTETSATETNSPYSASKAASDNFVRAFFKTYGLPAVITNCSNNYGPNQHKEKFIPTVITNALARKPVPVYGTGSNIRDWLYVEDHCDAINLILEHGVPGERYNIGGGAEIANIDLVHRLLALLDRSTDLISFVEDRPGHDLRYSIDCSKISSLGYHPTHTFEQGLEKTIAWYKNNDSHS